MSRAAPVCLILLCSAVAPRALADGRATRTPPPAAYVEECGACHVPYPARGLAAADWAQLMGRLEHHFGSDASLEPALAAQITAWLQANAGRGPAQAAAAEPPRLTRAAWFLREHDELPQRLRVAAEVKSAANCGACHRGATEGRYSEHEVRLPGAATLPSDGDRP